MFDVDIKAVGRVGGAWCGGMGGLWSSLFSGMSWRTHSVMLQSCTLYRDLKRKTPIIKKNNNDLLDRSFVPLFISIKIKK